MDKKTKTRLEKALHAYFGEIHKIYAGSNFREQSFYPALKTLLEGCSQLFRLEGEASVLVLPRKTQVGIPDFLVRTNGETVGYVEAKTPDEDLRDVEESEQLQRYRESLPNPVLTKGVNR